MAKKRTDRRYDDPAYVEEWRKAGKFPKIHDDIFTLLDNALRDAEPCLDLCASTGLLGRRIKQQLGNPVCAIEIDAAVIARGVYGKDIDILRMKVEPASLPRLTQWISEHRVKHVVARRCLSVLAVDTPLKLLGQTLWDAGVETITHEGLQMSVTVTDPFGPVEKTTKALERHWALRGNYRACHHLVRI